MSIVGLCSHHPAWLELAALVRDGVTETGDLVRRRTGVAPTGAHMTVPKARANPDGSGGGDRENKHGKAKKGHKIRNPL